MTDRQLNRQEAAGSLPPILGVLDVQRRYGLRDPRAARRVMRDAGSFTVGSRMVVRVDTLDAWEQAQAAPTPPAQERPRPARPTPRRSTSRTPRTGQPLRPGWWREAPGGDGPGAA